MYTLSNNKPQAGCIQWEDLRLCYQGEAYAIQDGYTNQPYCYWTPRYPNNLVVSVSYPQLGAEDCLVFLNKNGVAVVVPGSTALEGALIVPGTVLADALAANTITGDKIRAGAIAAGHLAADSVTANAVAANAIGAEAIAAGAVSADKLVAGAITTRELNSSQIFGDEATIRKVISGSGKFGEILAASAELPYIRTAVIESEALAIKVAGAKPLWVDTLPVSPEEGRWYVDGGQTPPVLCRWDGEGWQVVSDQGALREALAAQASSLTALQGAITQTVTKSDYEAL